MIKAIVGIKNPKVNISQVNILYSLDILHEHSFHAEFESIPCKFKLSDWTRSAIVEFEICSHPRLSFADHFIRQTLSASLYSIFCIRGIVLVMVSKYLFYARKTDKNLYVRIIKPALGTK